MFSNDEGRATMGSNLVFFLVGAAVGAAVAILYAPMSGEETRGQIVEKAGELKGKATEIKDQVVDKAGQWKEAAASKIQDLKGTATDTINAAKDGMNHVSQVGSREMSNVADAAEG
jgi:gas vesicle protein